MIQDYGFRIYNPTIGKFLSVDPLTNSYPWYTPYQFAGNKVIQAIDLDGLEEYIVTHRTFAPWERFGDFFGYWQESFDGDNRGFSLLPSTDETPGTPNKNASARIHQGGTISIGEELEGTEHRQFSSVTRGNNGFMGPETERYARSSGRGHAKFDGSKLIMRMRGTDPLVMGGGLLAPEIGWFLVLKLDKMEEGLKISGRLTGKEFPAYEAFITDSKGKSLFITTVSAPEKLDLGTELSNPFYDYRETIDLTILTDADGNFTGEMKEGIRIYDKVTILGLFTIEFPSYKVEWGETISIDDWNSNHYNTSPAPDCENNECDNREE